MSWDLQPQPQQGKNFVSVVQYTTIYETFAHRFVYKMMKYNSCAQTKKLLEKNAQKGLTPMIHELKYNFNLVTNKFCITFAIFFNMLSVGLWN